MTPLQKVAMGLVIVVIDPDLAGFDGVPDVLGWVLVSLGLFDLRRHLSGFGALVTLAMLSGAISVLLFHPSVAESLDESTGWYLSLPYLIFCIIVCGSVAGLIDQADPVPARRLSLLRWVFAALVPAPALLYGGGLDAQDILVAIVGTVAAAANVFLIYLLFKVSRRTPAVP